jgi:hypothetical protein
VLFCCSVSVEEKSSAPELFDAFERLEANDTTELIAFSDYNKVPGLVLGHLIYLQFHQLPIYLPYCLSHLKKIIVCAGRGYHVGHGTC